jgi:integrase
MARGTIRQKNGRYYVRTRVRVIDPKTGKPKWKDVEKAVGNDSRGKPLSKRAAERMLKDFQGAVDAGTFKPTTLTVHELGVRWLREHVQPNLKPSTAANYRDTFHTHISPALGAYRVDAVSDEMISSLLERKLTQGLSRQTVQKIHRHAHAMFAFAIRKKLVTVNPASTVEVPKDRRRKGRGTALSPAQTERFLRACSPRWRLFFRVALSTGLRRGEMIGLRWEDVSLSERVLYVRRSINPYDDITDEESLTTKTDAGERVVPLFPDAQEALEDLYRLAGDPSDDAPVFGTVEPKPSIAGRRESVPGGVLSPRLVTRAFRRYVEAAGLPEHLTLHDARHTTITRLVKQGADPVLVAAIAGHKRPSMTLDVYSHFQHDQAMEAAGQFDPSKPAPHRIPTDPAQTSSGNARSGADLERESPANNHVERT